MSRPQKPRSALSGGFFLYETGSNVIQQAELSLTEIF